MCHNGIELCAHDVDMVLGSMADTTKESPM